jgi:hypothetical protein
MYSFCSTFLLALLLLYILYSRHTNISNVSIEGKYVSFHHYPSLSPDTACLLNICTYITDTASPSYTSYLLSVSNHFVTFSTVIFFALPTDTYFPLRIACIPTFLPSCLHPYFLFALPTSLFSLRLAYFPTALFTSLLSSAFLVSLLSFPYLLTSLLSLAYIPTFPRLTYITTFRPPCLHPYFPFALLKSLLSYHLAYIPTFLPPCLHTYFAFALPTSPLSLRLAYIPTF